MFDGLLSGIAEVREFDPGSVSEAVLGERLVALERLVGQLESAVTEVAAAYHNRLRHKPPPRP